MRSFEYIVRPLGELDGRYLDSQAWTHDLDFAAVERGVICQAFNDDHEIGTLALDGDGRVLIVEVEPEHRRKGVVSTMLDELLAAGYVVGTNGELRDDGEAWARSLGGAAHRRGLGSHGVSSTAV